MMNNLGCEFSTVAEQLKGDKIELEIIDLRTISPIDVETIITSIRKTGRGVVVHEAQRTCGLGAEIIALINEKALLSLQAPVERVTGFDIPVPLLKTEHYYLPNPNTDCDGGEEGDELLIPSPPPSPHWGEGKDEGDWRKYGLRIQVS